MNDQTAFPFSPDEDQALHRRLLDGDPVAPADLCHAYLDRLSMFLIEHHPSVDAAMCTTAAEDAILALIKNPASFRPDRSSLDTYLRMSADGDLKNLLARERRRARHQVPWETVELSSRAGNELGDEEADPARMVELAETEMEQHRRWQDATQFLPNGTSIEGQVLDLLLAGERHTEAFAGVLGVGHLPLAQQRREVKRVKDRLKKRLQRQTSHE